jgi:hypothetical protein
MRRDRRHRSSHSVRQAQMEGATPWLLSGLTVVATSELAVSRAPFLPTLRMFR